MTDILTLPLRVCRGCGRKFAPRRPNNTKFCSMLCGKRTTNREWQRRRKGTDGPPRAISCQLCGKPLRTYRTTQKFCSVDCARGSAQPMEVSNHPAPPEFWTPDRQAALRRFWRIAEFGFEAGMSRKDAVSGALRIVSGCADGRAR